MPIHSSMYIWTLKLAGFVEVDCEQPMPPTNGTVSETINTQYGAEVYFGCDTGFRLIGTANSVCHLSGQWEPGAPTCQLIGNYYYFWLKTAIMF